MIVFGIKAELRLDGRRVNAVLVKTVTNCASKLHVPCRSLSLEIEVDLNVQTGNKLGVAQLPHMKVMTTDNSGKLFNVFLDVIDTEARGDGLEENARGGQAKRNGRGKDDAGNNQRNTGIGVVAPGKVGKPDEQGRSNDTNVAERVAHNMEKDTAHVEVAV